MEVQRQYMGLGGGHNGDLNAGPSRRFQLRATTSDDALIKFAAERQGLNWPQVFEGNCFLWCARHDSNMRPSGS
jgi:hypothetical protein